MKKNTKRIVMMASIILTMAVTMAGTLAWLYTNTEAVTNTFTPAKVGNFIDETFDNNVKSDVKIYNSIGSKTGEVDKLVDAYIRATYVVTWKDATNNIVIPVKDTDYEVVKTSSKWFAGSDGYYYYTDAVVPGGSTDNLIDSVKVRSGVTAPVSTVYPDSVFTLNVEIISQSIQAHGVTEANVPAAEDAWKVVTVNNGMLVAK